MLPPAASKHYREQQRLVAETLGLARREWAAMGGDFDASWARVGPRMVLLTGSAQLVAARAGAAYVPACLAQQQTPVTAESEVNPRAFAGVASDGRPLESLLYSAVTTAKQQVGVIGDVNGALAAGGRALDMYVHTMVADAARGAASVAITARPKVGWVRMVNPPCCSRCAILAGKWFRHNAGFRRHPRCDCSAIPALEDVAGDVGTDPDALFASGQVKGLSADERKSLEAGADLGQLVNARRGATGMTTTEGTSKRGFARQRLGDRKRLTPDGIYRIASDRTEAITLLRANGYVL